MKNIFKKVFVMLLALVLFLPTLSTVVYAADDANGKEPTEDEIRDNLYNAYCPSAPADSAAFTTLEERIHGNDVVGHMQLVTVKDGMALYNDPYTGEVIVLKLIKASAGEKQDKNGYKLKDHTCRDCCKNVCKDDQGNLTCVTYDYDGYWTSNPYDISTSQKISNDPSPTDPAIKANLYSQIILRFTQGTNEKSYFSFTDAAQYNQITTKNIKGGLRVEYIMGRLAVKYLCPERIALDKWLELYNKIKETDSYGAGVFAAMYRWYSSDTEGEYAKNFKENVGFDISPLNEEFIEKHPVSATRGLAVLNPNAVERERKDIEKALIKFYTMEQLDQDHAEMNYISTELESPVFRLALEYNLNEDGFSVRCNAANVRFNSEKYSLSNILVLPYAGCGTVTNEGYVFSPDGSGTIYTFDKVENTAASSSDRVYGQDYAFSSVSGANKEVIRIPVFGIQETEKIKVETNVSTDQPTEEPSSEEIVSSEESISEETPATSEEATESSEIESSEALDGTEESSESSETESSEGDVSTDSTIPTEETIERKHGFFAVIEEGESLANIIIERAGAQNPYIQAYTAFNPRPKDTYALNGGISAGANALWTVEADRKYTGDFKLKVFILSEDECSYVGMAKKYRKYLYDKGILNQLENKSEDIPLYLETIGAIDSTDRFMGVPYEIKQKISTYENVVSVLEQLSSEADISNVNIKLSGWANGGMNAIVPSKVELIEELGGEEGFKKLVEYCDQNGVGLFPEFEFSYATENELFDDFNAKKHTAKTIDNRNAFKKEYDPLMQAFVYTKKSIISTNSMLYFYDLAHNDFEKYSIKNISAFTLGSDLSSDFNKDDPLNREDAKGQIMELLKKMADENEQVMVSGGNAYVFEYSDHILNLPLENTMHIYSTACIPFLSFVLHGSIEYSGSAINLAGDMDTYFLKTIENGANPYFIIAYENASELKANNILSEYYSIRYSILKQSIVDTYSELNTILKYTKNYYMNSHNFIDNKYKVVKVGYSSDLNAADDKNDFVYYINYSNKDYEVSENGLEFVIEPLGYVVVNSDGEILEKGAATDE